MSLKVEESFAFFWIYESWMVRAQSGFSVGWRDTRWPRPYSISQQPSTQQRHGAIANAFIRFFVPSG
jgi:hypothetical protein